MRFASRKDLNFVLDDLDPIQVDPILDHNSFPVGKFLLTLENESQVKVLQSNISHKMPKRLQATSISSRQLNAFNTANKKGISGKTVRLRNIPSSVSESDLRFYFDGFSIKKDGFRKILESDRMGMSESSKTKSYNLKFNNQYLVDFESEVEAERAVREKNFGMLEGSLLQLYCYPF
jgi:RNA recognition motif-containing protein